MNDDMDRNRRAVIQFDSQQMNVSAENGRVSMKIQLIQDSPVASYESSNGLFGGRCHNMVLNKNQIKTLALGLEMIADRMTDNENHAQDPEVLEDQERTQTDP